MNRLEDTIIAISTPLGCGGLGIVRLSGPKALSVARRIFRPRKKTDWKKAARTMLFGEVYNGAARRAIDEGYLVFFPKPHSYTTEDVVEISCHGSPVVLEEVVGLGIRAGARQAHPGEFTLRAYLRGRIDLLQAEAVNDLIAASSIEQATISFGQVRGALSNRIGLWRRQIVELISEIEAAIEFPDEALGISRASICRKLEAVLAEVKALLASFETGRSLTEGLCLAIVGRANVGKSTLFNALLEEKRAIVSPDPGTTRDYLRERVRFGGSVFRLVDMAGLGRSSHPVEREGARKGWEIASEADGVLFVLDGSRPASAVDLRLLERLSGKEMIVVVNKADLPRRMERKLFTAAAGKRSWVEVSALQGKNIGRLKEAIVEVFVPGKGKQEEMIFHLRQKLQLAHIEAPLERALKLFLEGHAEEVCIEEVRRVIPEIGRLTGEIRSDEVIDNIFGRFCVGK